MLKNSKNKRLLTNYNRFVKRRLIRNNVSTIPPRTVPIVTHVSRHSPLMISSSNTPLVPSSSTLLQPNSNTLVPSSSTPLVPSSSTQLQPSSNTLVPSSSTPLHSNSRIPLVPSFNTHLDPSSRTPLLPSSRTPLVPSSSTPLLSSFRTTLVPSSETPLVPSSSIPLHTSSSASLHTSSSTPLVPISSTHLVSSSSTPLLSSCASTSNSHQSTYNQDSKQSSISIHSENCTNTSPLTDSDKSINNQDSNQSYLSIHSQNYSGHSPIPKNSNTPNYCLDPYRYDPRREVHPIPPNLHMSSNHFNPHVLKPNSYHTQHVNRYQPQYVNHYNSQYVNYNHQHQHRPRLEHSFGHYPSSHNPSPYYFHQHQVSSHHHPYSVPEHGQQYQHLINPQPHIHYNQFSQKKNYVSGIATLQMNEEHCKAVKDFLIPKNLVLAKVLDENKGVHIHTREEGSKYILSSKELAIFQHLVDKLHQYVPPKTWRWCEEEENELLEKLKIIKYGKTYRVDLRRKYIIYILIRKNQSKNIKYHFPSQKLNHTREVEIREQRMRENPRDIQLRLEQEKFQQEQELHMRQQFLQVETNNTMMKKSEINSNNTQTNSSNSSQNIEEGQEIRREKREIRGRDRSTIEELRELKKLINANASKEYLYLKFPEWMEWTIASCNNVGLIENVDDYIKAVWIPKVQK